jgi:hypothetical protein
MKYTKNTTDRHTNVYRFGMFKLVTFKTGIVRGSFVLIFKKWNFSYDPWQLWWGKPKPLRVFRINKRSRKWYKID